MQNVDSVECLKTFECLVGYSPNEWLIDHASVHLGPVDQLEDVPALQALSDDAEAVGELIEEGVSVGEYERA